MPNNCINLTILYAVSLRCTAYKMAGYAERYMQMEFRMNINATLLGQFILLSVIVISSLSYYLGKRKTQNVKTTTFIGFLLSFIPPLGLIFIAILALKNDISNNNTSNV